MMPGANDNASGVAVVMAVARRARPFELRPQRTVAFIFFGAEEQGVRGSEFYLDHVPALLKRTKAADQPRRGGPRQKDLCPGGEELSRALEIFRPGQRRPDEGRCRQKEYFHNRARPRLDAARFMWAGIPTVSFSAGDAPELPYPIYHTRHDAPDILTPAIMVDLGRLIFSGLVDLAACR